MALESCVDDGGDLKTGTFFYVCGELVGVARNPYGVGGRRATRDPLDIVSNDSGNAYLIAPLRDKQLRVALRNDSRQG
jgi:hypothetical protein